MFHTLPGFREFYPEACARRNHIFRLWKQAAHEHGFTEYDPPLLEPLELYIEKSGEEIVGQLYNFEDKGGRKISLRPELTPSLARLVGAKANSLKRPVKWFAIGENFRYERQQKGRLRSHYQLNGDILGEPGPGADAELIAFCLRALQIFGLQPGEILLRLSDRTLWMLYLSALGLEENAILQVLGAIDKMEREPREVTAGKLTPVFGDAAGDFLSKVETLVQIRQWEDLRAFFLSHLVHAEHKELLESRLRDWAWLLRDLQSLGWLPWVRIDLGIVRGLAYYTGFVFEVFSFTEEGVRGRALAGGGRYDHLVRKLGYPDMPAVGFGMGDVTLTDLLLEKKLLPEYVDRPDLYVICGGGRERQVALQAVTALRSAGWRVEYSLKEAEFGRQFKQAGASGARLALILGTEEVEAGVVKLRDMELGAEQKYPDAKLMAATEAFFEQGKLMAFTE